MKRRGASRLLFGALVMAVGVCSGSSWAGTPPTITPNISSTVFDGSNDFWGSMGLELNPATAYDTVTVTDPTTMMAVTTGTVSYTVFNNGSCTPAGAGAGSNLAYSGGWPNSTSETPLAAGNYSFQATYNGDSVTYLPATGPCEPFTVGIPTSVAPVLHDAGALMVWNNSETTGAQAFGTATLTPNVSSAPFETGQTNYNVYSGMNCTGTPVYTSSPALTSGGQPNDSAIFPNAPPNQGLPAGSYCFQVVYPGDANYLASISAAQPFTVNQGPTSTTTVFTNASSGGNVAGDSFFDTATVTALDTSFFSPTNTVTYNLYSSDSCTGTTVNAMPDNESVGSPSQTSPGLPPGAYSYLATYNGDSNFTSSTAICESFNISQQTPSVSTPAIIDASTGLAWSGSEDTGASAYAKVTFSGINGLTPTSPTPNVTFTFYSDGACTSLVSTDTPVSLAGGVAQSAGTGPLAAGAYSFKASYGGDTNFTGATSACQSFGVDAVPPGTASTVVEVSGANTAWSAGGEPLGTSAYDTWTIKTQGGFTPTGTVTYQYYTGATCTGAALGPMGGDTVNLSAGTPPPSFSTIALTAGTYSFGAVYSGDANYNASSVCAAFAVNQHASVMAVVLDPGTQIVGSVASETSTVSGINGFVPTGTVTYTLFKGGCPPPPLPQATQYTPTPLALNNGNAPASGPTSPLPAGGYGFLAAYSGDNNYEASSQCASFAVDTVTTTTTNAVDDASTNLAWNGTEVTGATAYDTSTVTPSNGSNGIIQTGTVTYSLYSAAGCSGVAATQVVTLNANGTVPNSSTTAPLPAGPFSYKAVYSGDSNYITSTSACVTKTVLQANQSVNSVVDDTSTNDPWSGSESSGASAYDTSTITKKGNSTPTGTVTYSFYSNGTCTAPATSTQMPVTVTAGGAVPNSSPTSALLPGTYSFQAAYSGDANYAAASSCSEFFVQNNPIVITPASWTLAPLGNKTFTVSGGTGNGYVWTLTQNQSSGTLVGSGNTAAYHAGSIGSTTDIITVTDSLGETGTANVTVSAPLTLVPGSPTTPPQGAIKFTAGGGQPPYTFKLQVNGSGGTINANTGAYVAGTTGSTTDTVLVTDANGSFTQTNVTVTAGVSITPANPSVAPAGMVAFSASGGSGTGFAWSITANRSGGMINASTGAYVAGSKAMVSDVVTVVDSLGNTASVSVSVGGGVTISPFNPSVAPKGTQAFTAMGGSGSGYAWKLTANPSGGSVNASTGAYTAGATGNRTDVLQVTDSLGNTATTNITVTAGIAINPATASVAPLGTVKFSASGGSGTGFTYSLTTNASGGSVNAATGAYKAGATGGVTDVVEVADSLGNTATASVTVTGALAITPTSANAPPRGAVAFMASGGSGTYIFALQTNASGGSINANTGAYTAGATPNVVDVVSVADSNGATATAKVSVGPGVTISPTAPSVAPGGMVAFTAMGGSGTGFTWSLTTNQSGGGITASGAYTAGMTGKTVDTVKVVDSLGNSATTSVSVGGGLAINPTMATTPPLGSVAFSAIGGAGGFTYKISTNASGGTINASTGAYTAGSKGNVTDVVTVTDSAGTTATANVNVGPGITVTPAMATVTAGTMLPFGVTGGSGTGYTWSINPNNSGGSINAMTGVYTAGMTGGVMDTVVVKDSLGNTGSAVVTVKPNPMMPDGGTDSGMPEDSGMPMMDSGSPMKDASTGMDSSMPMMDASSSNDSGSNSDSGFEVEGGEGGTNGGQSTSNGGCGCAVVGFDSSGFGALGGLALGLALMARRRRRH